MAVLSKRVYSESEMTAFNLKLHGLNESHFPDFKYEYINEEGYVSKEPAEIKEGNRFNLMIMRWDNE